MTASVMGQDLFAGTFRNGIPDLGRSQVNHHSTISGFPTSRNISEKWGTQTDCGIETQSRKRFT
jgi:hypothetical protein